MRETKQRENVEKLFKSKKQKGEWGRKQDGKEKK